MRTLGIDIGTTTISAVVADSQNGSVERRLIQWKIRAF